MLQSNLERSIRAGLLVLIGGGMALAASAAGDDDWPAWRGPLGTGVARGSAPLRWSDEQNVHWKVAIPGRGFSTPVVWGDKLFLTTAIPLEEQAQPPEEEQGRRGRGGSSGPEVEHDFVVLCLDRETGAELWRKSACRATPHEGFHRTYGSFASSSPVTDGERLYVSFGSRGLYCYDLAGELVWKKDFGVRMRMRNSFGEGSAPALFGDTLVQLFDHEGDSFLVALDKATGELRWRVERDEPSSWATPLILEHEGVAQVITTGTNEVRAYELSSGELIWRCKGLGTNCIPVPVVHEGKVLVMSGHRDPNIMAIRLGGKGDLSGSEHVVWSTPKGASYTASPVLFDGLLYCVTDRGFLSCYDAASGEGTYVETRLPRGSTLKASPVAADGHLYVPTEAGDVHVLRLGPDYELVATNTLEDQFFVASPLVVDGCLYLRSRSHLICVGKTE